jgi:hypothetical protein
VLGISNLHISTIFYWMLELFRQWYIYFFILLLVMKKITEWQLLNKYGCDSSSVIKIVKVKYNRIDIKWWLVSTSFKIYLEILSNLYITFTIFYYNTISLKRTFIPVLVMMHFLYHLTNVFTNCSMNIDQLVFKLIEVTLVLIRKSLKFLLLRNQIPIVGQSMNNWNCA